jgi:hypothetical protein
MLEKRRLITFNRVTHKLQRPADDQQRQRPAPVEEKQRQRDHNQRNADAMRKSVQRMPMPGFVVFDKGVRHDASLKTKAQISSVISVSSVVTFPDQNFHHGGHREARRVSIPNIYKDIHRSAAHHSFFARFFRG